MLLSARMKPFGLSILMAAMKPNRKPITMLQWLSCFNDFEIVTAAPWESPTCVENRVNLQVGTVSIEDVETTLEDVWRFLRTLSEDATDPGLASAVLQETAAYFGVDGVLEDGDLSTQLSRIRSMAENTLKVK